MDKLFRELSGWIVTALVFAAVTVILVGSSLLEKVGRRMEVQGEDFSHMSDCEAVASVCERKEPMICCIGKRVWETGENISVSQIFEAIDAEGTKLEITVMDITDQEGNSVIGCYREDVQQAVFFEQGIYTFLLKAMDKERKSCTEKRCILIDCR